MAAPQGEAAGYYDNRQQFIDPQQQQGYPTPQMAYQPPQQGYNNNYQGQGPKYTQAPPNYGTSQAFNEPQPGGKQTYEQTFKIEKPKWNDLWAGILFILVFAGFVAVSGLTIQSYAKYKGFNGGGIYDGSNTFSLDTNTLILFIFVLCVAFAFSWAYFLAARAFTKAFIWITGILNVAFAIGTAIYYLIKHLYGAGIVFAIFGAFALFCFISWIPRIPFSVLMLQTCMDVSRHHGHVFLVSFLGGVASIAFAAWFSVTLVAVYVKYEPNSNGANPSCGTSGCSTATVIGLIVFITFAGYWISEFMKNVLHTTVAGVYGSWYFCSGKPGGMPTGATRGAFRRSMTYSFGSISLGSLIVALINMLRQACSIAQQQEASQGNIIGSIMFCCLGCIIALLDWAVTFINRYAFSHIALYGKAYIPAAKDTWKMMKDRGIDALINDLLIGPVITMGSLFTAYLCALLAYLYLQFTEPEYNNNGKFTPVIMAFAFLIGLQVCQIFMTPVSSGVDTLFVAMAWDPDVLVREHGDLWARMVSVYPHVQQAIHA